MTKLLKQHQFYRYATRCPPRQEWNSHLMPPRRSNLQTPPPKTTNMKTNNSRRDKWTVSCYFFASVFSLRLNYNVFQIDCLKLALIVLAVTKILRHILFRKWRRKLRRISWKRTGGGGGWKRPGQWTGR